MNKYICQFFGREIRAIGINEMFKIEIVAHDIPSAILKIYDTHEHLSHLTINSQPYNLNGTVRE